MRKHDVRKWLHAILDLLPVILIPVFMIYSHRHTIDSGSIDVPQNQVVDFNQRVKNGNFSQDDLYWSTNVISSESTITTYDNTLSFSTILTSGDKFVQTTLPNFNIGDKFLFSFDINVPSTFDNIKNVAYIFTGNGLGYSSVSASQFARDQFVHYATISTVTYNGTPALNLFRFMYDLNGGVVSVRNVQLFNLTQMFGSGNEPTLQQFNVWYNADYYSFTLGRKELLKGTSSITYDDTDIMSQVVYQLYNSVDKYFNMGNVFNMTGVYDWFNLNIFNGNAPISIYIVWNIVLYEFVMDLLFLLYGLFMWFIDMVEKLMEKPLKSVK